MTNRAAYGGQAVVEGVMIRGKARVATAVRLKDGSITTRRETVTSLAQRHKWLAWPIIRGTPALFESMALGYRMLMWSADTAMEAEQQEKPKAWQTALTMIVAMAFAIGLFVLLPAYATSHLWGLNGGADTRPWLQQLMPSPERILPNIVEGLFKLLALVGYILLIARMDDVKRIFAYHGAEHKVVNAYEFTGELSVAAAKQHSRIHPRCGTAFIFLTMVVGILLHALVGFPGNKLLLLGSRLVLLVPLAGVSYELLRLAGRFRDFWLLKAIVSPGLLLQRLTTAEPNDEQIEVALASMRAVLEDEGVVEPLTPDEPKAAEAT